MESIKVNLILTYEQELGPLGKLTRLELNQMLPFQRIETEKLQAQDIH